MLDQDLKPTDEHGGLVCLSVSQRPSRGTACGRRERLCSLFCLPSNPPATMPLVVGVVGVAGARQVNGLGWQLLCKDIEEQATRDLACARRLKERVEETCAAPPPANPTAPPHVAVPLVCRLRNNNMQPLGKPAHTICHVAHARAAL